jgi:hypothetical protein
MTVAIGTRPVFKSKVIRNQSLGIATGIGLKNDFAQTFHKIITIEIIFKDLSAFNPPGNNMMQCTGGLPAIARLRRGKWGQVCC